MSDNPVPRQACKVVHLTSVHPPFDVRIFHKECKTLAAAGFDVVLVAPHGQDLTEDGVRLRAVPRPSNRQERARKTVGAVLRAALAEDAAIYHFHDPELIPVGLALKARGKRVIYDVHEDVPEDVLTKDYIPLPIRRGVARGADLAERIGAAAFDAIVTVTPTIARRFPAARTHLVQNFPIPGELEAVTPGPYAERPPLAVYAGVINAVRGIPETLGALARLPETSPARLALAGNFVPASLEEQVRSMPGWARVDFLGWQSRPEIAHLLSRGRMGLVLFQPLANHVAAQPNKLFEYMAAGMPVIASDFPRWRELVEGAGCGLLVDPRDEGAIANAITWLLDHPAEAEAMGKRGMEAVATRYNWDTQGRVLVELYRTLTAREGR